MINTLLKVNSGFLLIHDYTKTCFSGRRLIFLPWPTIFQLNLGLAGGDSLKSPVLMSSRADSHFFRGYIFRIKKLNYFSIRFDGHSPTISGGDIGREGDGKYLPDLGFDYGLVVFLIN